MPHTEQRLLLCTITWKDNFLCVWTENTEGQRYQVTRPGFLAPLPAPCVVHPPFSYVKMCSGAWRVRMNSSWGPCLHGLPSSVWLTDHYSKQCPMTRSPTIPLPAWEPDLRARALHKSLANTIWAASSVQGESSRLAQDQISEDGIGIRRKRADGSMSPTWLQSGSSSGEWMCACARWPAAYKTLRGPFLSVGAHSNLGNRSSKRVMTLSILLMFMRFLFSYSIHVASYFLTLLGREVFPEGNLTMCIKSLKLPSYPLTKNVQVLYWRNPWRDTQVILY